MLEGQVRFSNRLETVNTFSLLTYWNRHMHRCSRHNYCNRLYLEQHHRCWAGAHDPTLKQITGNISTRCIFLQENEKKPFEAMFAVRLRAWIGTLTEHRCSANSQSPNHIRDCVKKQGREMWRKLKTNELTRTEIKQLHHFTVPIT